MKNDVPSPTHTFVTHPDAKKGGFAWWLLWIAIAVGSFIFSAMVWTWLIGTFFGEIKSTPLTILWTSAVFGSWLLTMIPIIRAKERYWNRMSQEDETNITWWIGWMALTITAFFASVGFWTWFYAREGVSLQTSGNTAKWVFSVFGTWMLALLPLIVIMYQKVDRAYEKARIRRESREEEAELTKPRARTVFINSTQRTLEKTLSRRLREIPATLKRGKQVGHLVTAVLKDGRRVEHVFISNRSEVLGVYGQEKLTFTSEEISDFEPANLGALPGDFSEQTWLRLDGRA